MRRLADALWAQPRFKRATFWRESAHLGATGAGWSWR